MPHHGKGNIAADLLKGAVAGGVATWAMSQLTTYLYQYEDPQAKQKEQRASGGIYSNERAAEKVARLAGRELSEEQRKKAGKAVHWALGIGMGALYALLRRRVEGIDRAQGLGFGTGFWALVDEGLTPALGLAAGPAEYPWQSHARGLAGHLAYGVVADTVLDVLDRVA